MGAYYRNFTAYVCLFQQTKMNAQTVTKSVSHLRFVTTQLAATPAGVLHIPSGMASALVLVKLLFLISISIPFVGNGGQLRSPSPSPQLSVRRCRCRRYHYDGQPHHSLLGSRYLGRHATLSGGRRCVTTQITAA